MSTISPITFPANFLHPNLRKPLAAFMTALCTMVVPEITDIARKSDVIQGIRNDVLAGLEAPDAIKEKPLMQDERRLRYATDFSPAEKEDMIRAIRQAPHFNLDRVHYQRVVDIVLAREDFVDMFSPEQIQRLLPQASRDFTGVPQVLARKDFLLLVKKSGLDLEQMFAYGDQLLKTGRGDFLSFLFAREDIQDLARDANYDLSKIIDEFMYLESWRLSDEFHKVIVALINNPNFKAIVGDDKIENFVSKLTNDISYSREKQALIKREDFTDLCSDINLKNLFEQRHHREGDEYRLLMKRPDLEVLCTRAKYPLKDILTNAINYPQSSVVVGLAENEDIEHLLKRNRLFTRFFKAALQEPESELTLALLARKDFTQLAKKAGVLKDFTDLAMDLTKNPKFLEAFYKNEDLLNLRVLSEDDWCTHLRSIPAAGSKEAYSGLLYNPNLKTIAAKVKIDLDDLLSRSTISRNQSRNQILLERDDLATLLKPESLRNLLAEAKTNTRLKWELVKRSDTPILEELAQIPSFDQVLSPEAIQQLGSWLNQVITSYIPDKQGAEKIRLAFDKYAPAALRGLLASAQAV